MPKSHELLAFTNEYGTRQERANEGEKQPVACRWIPAGQPQPRIPPTDHGHTTPGK